MAASAAAPQPAGCDGPGHLWGDVVVLGLTKAAALNAAWGCSVALGVAVLHILACMWLRRPSLCCPRAAPAPGVHAPEAGRWNKAAPTRAMVVAEALLAGTGCGLAAMLVPPHIAAMSAAFVGCLVAWTAMHAARIRAVGLISFLSPESRDSLLNVRLLDWLRAPSLSIALAKYAPLFWPGVDDAALAAFLRTAPRSFQQAMLRPGLVHALPEAAAALILPAGTADQPAEATSLPADSPASDQVGDAGEASLRSSAGEAAAGKPQSGASPTMQRAAGAAAAGATAAAAAAGASWATGTPITAQTVALPSKLLPPKSALWASGFIASLRRARLDAQLRDADQVMDRVEPALTVGAVASAAAALVVLATSGGARRDVAKMARRVALGVPATAFVLLMAAAWVAKRWPSLRVRVLAVVRELLG
ncbi:hypothetical protein FNF27_07761 [Cafeteria roenbergensis]|uniref:Uncharacterized protein n=1 Tax=Cafeteria roenbergensis TaxID=33653 RepID=A0A5A8CM41_CAFRO|nr:hypothetical protein FNF29_03368 [Cafeteria roenbergensis]KAA0164620.1 hypothetical protein FNF27_07761 [Cafeteria roenbergensis]|mmetsp:Transcript_5245/g.22303  ORF Transcript_5245/g.22303 Transcript_5245/m.22303 type:complete len:420 (-) Transcript_5245:2710-3969(-)|eukprot:KAA0153180.1 hypothetical protein FNF29_03368 [Cafeteria roenbergensis]